MASKRETLRAFKKYCTSFEVLTDDGSDLIRESIPVFLSEACSIDLKDEKNDPPIWPKDMVQVACQIMEFGRVLPRWIAETNEDGSKTLYYPARGDELTCEEWNKLMATNAYKDIPSWEFMIDKYGKATK